VVEAGLAAGYGADNWIDPRRYRVTSTVCQQVGDPTRWSARVNDQSIVLGWAGYDPNTRYLPPEHFLAHVLREALTAACRNGRLQGQGPDGKLMVRLREDSAGWTLEQVLVTLQQREERRSWNCARASPPRSSTSTGKRGSRIRAGARPGRRWTC
jgi:S-adenosylmethionine synthetase